MANQFTPPLTSATRTYYVLRRRDTGHYVALDGFRRFREADEPIGPLAKLSTARSHRLRILGDRPEVGLIDIEQIEIVCLVKCRTEEDQTVTDRLVALCGLGHHGEGWMEHFEKVLRTDADARAMRYAIVFQSLPSQTARSFVAWKTVQVRGQTFALAGNTADLLAIRMHEDAKPILIYDFEEKRALLQPPATPKVNCVKGSKSDDTILVDFR